MSPEFQHHRDSEPATDHRRRDDGMIPYYLKVATNFIRDIGFPITMCLILTYVLLVVVKRNTEAISDLRIAIVTLTERIQPYKATKGS